MTLYLTYYLIVLISMVPSLLMLIVIGESGDGTVGQLIDGMIKTFMAGLVFSATFIIVWGAVSVALLCIFMGV